jgi:hypothetical protein
MRTSLIRGVESTFSAVFFGAALVSGICFSLLLYCVTLFCARPSDRGREYDVGCVATLGAIAVGFWVASRLLSAHRPFGWGVGALAIVGAWLFVFVLAF